jgi:hypothetical protein
MTRYVVLCPNPACKIGTVTIVPTPDFTGDRETWKPDRDKLEGMRCPTCEWFVSCQPIHTLTDDEPTVIHSKEFTDYDRGVLHGLGISNPFVEAEQ